MLLLVFADAKEGVGLIHALASVIVDTHSVICAGLIHALASVIVDTHSFIFAGLIHAIFMCDRGHTLGHGGDTEGRAWRIAVDSQVCLRA